MRARSTSTIAWWMALILAVGLVLGLLRALILRPEALVSGAVGLVLAIGFFVPPLIVLGLVVLLVRSEAAVGPRRRGDQVASGVFLFLVAVVWCVTTIDLLGLARAWWSRWGG